MSKAGMMTFKAKVVIELQDFPPPRPTEPSLQDVMNLLQSGKYETTLIPSFDTSYEPTLIITEILNKSSK